MKLEKKGRVFKTNRAIEFAFLVSFLLFFAASQVEATNLILGSNFTIPGEPNGYYDTGVECVTEPNDPKCVGNAFDWLSNDADSSTYWQSDSSVGNSKRQHVIIDLLDNYTFTSITIENYGAASSWTDFTILGSSTTNASDQFTLYSSESISQGANYTFNFTEPTTLAWLNITGGPANNEYLLVNEIYLNVTKSGGNLTLQPKDQYLNTSLQIFNVTIGSTQYNSTAGSIVSNIAYGNASNLTILFEAPNFLPQYVTNYNASLNGSTFLKTNMTFYKSRHNITAFQFPQNTTAINNFTLNLTDGQNFNISNGSKLVNTSWNTSVGITIRTNNYVDQTYTTNGTSNEGHQFNLGQEDTFSLTFYDEITTQLLNGHNVSIELISDSSGGNYSTENGSINIPLLIPEDYVIRFSTDWSFEREHHITLTDDTYEQIDLYALNKTYDNLVSATGVTLSVITNLNDDLEDATIIASKYFVNESDYNVVERLKTNFEGEVKGYFTNDEFYKFFIYYGGELVLTTTATKITDSTLTFVVDISEDPTGDYFTTENIDYTLTYNNNTEQFVYVYSDGSSSSSYNCLYIYRKSITEETAINSSCSSASSGTLSVTINPINGTTYLAKTTALIDGETYLIDAIIYEHGLGKELGLVGAIIILFITIAFLFVGRWNPTIMIMFLPLPTLFGAIIGLVAIPVAVMVSITLGCWIIAGVLSRNS